MNIFWFIADSICNYERPDKFGLLPIFKKFRDNKEGFYFEDAISQFSSTTLSVFSMLTGRFPYYILPDYYRSIEALPSYEKDNCIVPLREANYNCQSIMFGSEAAIVFKEILRPYYVENMYHGDELLDAREVFQVFTQKIDDLSKKENNFLYVHFRPADPETDEYLNKTINYLKEKGLWEDSIIIINSDHGYYDRNRYRKINLLHFNDIHLSSLQPAFFMKIPANLTKSAPKTIKKRVYLLDIMETVLDYLNLEIKHEKESISFKDLIENDIDVNKNRVIRADCYLLLQPIKKVAILKDNWKLSISNRKSTLHNLNNDFLEKKDIKAKYSKIYDELYNFYKLSESKGYNTLKPMIDKLFNQSILKSLESENIFIPKQFPPHLVNYLKEKLKNKNKILNSAEVKENDYRDIITIVFFNRLTGYGVKKLNRRYGKISKKVIIIDTKLFDSSDKLKSTGYLRFVLNSLINRRKQLLQRWKEILIWVFYFPWYFNRYLKKYYD